MKFVIATGIFPPDIGGPAKYAAMITHTAHEMGHSVRIARFSLEKRLPTGVRHVFFFLKTCFKLIGTQGVLALDTFSVGFPALCAAKVMRKKIVVRVGGDFLWEMWVERTKQQVHLSEFYLEKRALSFKEKCVRFLITRVYRHADVVAFTTEWQKRFTQTAYGIPEEKCAIVENYYGEKKNTLHTQGEVKTFLAVGRPIVLKNIELLQQAFNEVKQTKGGIELITGTFPPDRLEEKIAQAGVIVVPSFSEVAPNIILEGLRYGKPFILTKDSGLCEELGDVGVCVDPFDVSALAEAIRSLSYPAYYESYASKAQNFKKIHTWEDIVSEYCKLL